MKSLKQKFESLVSNERNDFENQISSLVEEFQCDATKVYLFELSLISIHHLSIVLTIVGSVI